MSRIEADNPVLGTEIELKGRTLPIGEAAGVLETHADVGIVSAKGISGQVVHRAGPPTGKLFECRATPTPKGDYLLMFPEGEHYNSKHAKVNTMLAYRSSDRGRTWEGPTVAFDIDYSQHGFLPLIPRGSERIYAFGTQPVLGQFTTERGLGENAPIGFRYSEDDGHSWSEVRLIRPRNDPEFRGMSVMRMCETDDGTWLIGSHEGDWSYKPLMTRQYILRSEDRGKTWDLLPRERHGGWCYLARNRMDELRPINLGNGKVLALARTAEGHLFCLRSEDDGKTWTEPKPTPLVHPDAPPMLFHLSDGKTLAAFHHNRFSDRNYSGLGQKPEIMKDRAEIWVALSRDDGETWSEPRFVFTNALEPNLGNPFRDHQCSYMDMFTDEGKVHLFVPQRWQRVLHLWFEEDVLETFPTADDVP